MVSTNGAGTPVSNEVSNVQLSKQPGYWAGRKRIQRERNKRQAAENKPTPEFPDAIKPEPEIEIKAEPVVDNKSEPQIKSETPELKPEAPITDPAAERIRQQLEADRLAQEYHRQQQQQAEQINQQVGQVFEFWRQAGLSPAQQQLLRARPDVMIQLTDHAARQAGELGHGIGSPEYIEAGKRAFFENLTRLQQPAQAPQPLQDTEPMPIDSPAMPLPPQPRPQPQAPSRASLYSAPPSRELPGGFRDRDLGQQTISAAEAEAARISNITPAEYIRQRERLRQLRAAGLYDSEPQR